MRASLLVFALLVAAVSADLYLHNPRGSNDRNRERNQQRQNANRLFNSQNNAQGGYPWAGDATVRAAPDAITYYTGSQVQLEWTNQHSCSPNADANVQCTMIVQYACDNPTTTGTNAAYPFPMKGLRDGYPDSDTVSQSDNNNAGYTRREFTTTSGQNQDGTTRISADQFAGSATTRQARYNYYYTAVSGNPGVEYGMHEGIDWYDLCRSTSRNFGLYHSDQNQNGNDARFTRQNNNGNQHGLECPEEREYYPYWRPYVIDANSADKQDLPLAGVSAAWYDVLVMTNSTANCEFFQTHSQNCRGYGQCLCDAACRTKANINGGLIPWDEYTCRKSGGAWVQPLGDATSPNSTTGYGPGLLQGTLADGRASCKPDCMLHPMSRDNHLGNYIAVDSATGQLQAPTTGQPEPAGYTWTVPQRLAGMICVLRFRYNMSASDFPDHSYLPTGEGFAASDVAPTQSVESGWDSAYDCRGQFAPNNLAGKSPDSSTPLSKYHCYTLYSKQVGPLAIPARAIFNRPYVPVFGTGNPSLALAQNTNQYARTFQDRSYVFNVANRPSTIDRDAKIVNLNMRGRRGNIVQAYPSVEYDFIPDVLKVTDADYVHFQVWGSDFNNALNANDGEGWQYSDRSNMVQTDRKADNQPSFYADMTMFQVLDNNFKSTGVPDLTKAMRFALLDQTACQTFTDGQNNDQNNYNNCGKLNKASARWPRTASDGILNFRAGTYYYMNTRNNNFSNRSQKGVLYVEGTSSAGLSGGAIAGAVIGSLAGAGLIAAGVLFYGKRHPNSRAGDAYKKCVGCMPQQCKGGSSGSTYGAGSTTGHTTTGGDTEYVRHG